MVVFYQNIIDEIMAGVEYNYSIENLTKLVDWADNDKRSKTVINEERKL
ncbi:hypothetical protein [Clostridium sp.]|nr:hypothetical protein [Clostridium sp.]MBK5242142.1 hypothetical protein [Clostridium sp.]